MSINFYPLARGIASYVLPGSLFHRPGSGGTFSSQYCYSVWLRHLHYLISKGLIKDINQLENIAEIGPGDSLGIGLCGLYTGAKNYFAFDVIHHANLRSNLAINNELATFFQEGMPVPHGAKFNNVGPALEDYTFPKALMPFTREYYSEKRVLIEQALSNGAESSKLGIKYIVPWNSTSNSNISNVDLIFSQAVMEHVLDIVSAYSEMFRWLKPGGVISHQIDFKTHEMTKEWNGHWFIPRGIWSVLAHGRKYPMNRFPLSSHVKAIEQAGFVIKHVLPVYKPNRYKNRMPKIQGIDFTSDDLSISSALVQAIKA